MNEQIRELAKQADLDWHKHWNDDESNRLEKFAELIVKECAIIAKNKQYKHSPAHSVGDCAAAIREHFGVK